jgi:2-phospho-L-lactate/phosphoenolpyruvate guanylyltransferase
VKTIAVLPIKRFEQAKQRLEGVPERPRLAAEMARAVLRALADAASLDAVVVVTADADAAADARACGATVVDEGSPRGHSQAARLGVAYAVGEGAERVLLVPGDCPLLAADDVDGLLERHGDAGVVVVPDRHGTGTNALLLTPPEAIAPAFGEGSCARHVALADAAGVPCAVDEVPALLLDVDTPADLEAVRLAR